MYTVCNSFTAIYAAVFDETPDEMLTQLTSIATEYDNPITTASSDLGFMSGNSESASNVQSDTLRDMGTAESITEDTVKALEERKKKKEERKNSMRIAMIRMKEAQVVSTAVHTVCTVHTLVKTHKQVTQFLEPV